MAEATGLASQVDLCRFQQGQHQRSLAPFETAEALKLFGRNDSESPMDCRVTIQHRNRLLQDGLSKATGSWRYLVAGRDPDNNCTVDEIIALGNKALILLRSYKIALEKMDKPLGWTYKQCCKGLLQIK